LKKETRSLETLTIIVESPPYGNENVWDAFRLAQALKSVTVGMTVNIFLLGDGVVAAKKGQAPPSGYYNLGNMLQELVQHGSNVIACRTCIGARGLKEEDLIPGVKVGTMMDLAKWVEGSQKLLTF
jgi:uncharacterized protein involved in oxidation of intracellular sulfur